MLPSSEWMTFMSEQAANGRHQERYLIAFLATTWACLPSRETSPDATLALNRLKKKLITYYMEGWDEASVWHARLFGGEDLRHLADARSDKILDTALDEIEEDLLRVQASPGHLEASNTEK